MSWHIRLSYFLALALAAGAAGPMPQYPTIDALWGGYDPRALPVEAEVAKEEIVDGVVLRTVYYMSEVTDGFKVRIIADYGFPVCGKNLPAVMQLHGGGQNAMADYVKLFAKRGYACLSVNWGGRPLEGKPENGKTDWGPLRYNQSGADTGSFYAVEPPAREPTLGITGPSPDAAASPSLSSNRKWTRGGSACSASRWEGRSHS